MELPRRERGDELLAPGEMTKLRMRLRRLAPRHDLVSVIACAFDHRTRMLPFIYSDTRMAPAGVRSIGAAMVDAGFEKTRIVLQQWNRHFRPSSMRLDGRSVFRALEKAILVAYHVYALLCPLPRSWRNNVGKYSQPS
jgi:hypothetical protein